MFLGGNISPNGVMREHKIWVQPGAACVVSLLGGVPVISARLCLPSPPQVEVFKDILPLGSSVCMHPPTTPAGAGIVKFATLPCLS